MDYYAMWQLERYGDVLPPQPEIGEEYENGWQETEEAAGRISAQETETIIN